MLKSSSLLQLRTQYMIRFLTRCAEHVAETQRAAEAVFTDVLSSDRLSKVVCTDLNHLRNVSILMSIYLCIETPRVSIRKKLLAKKKYLSWEVVKLNKNVLIRNILSKTTRIFLQRGLNLDSLMWQKCCV